MVVSKLFFGDGDNITASPLRVYRVPFSRPLPPPIPNFPPVMASSSTPSNKDFRSPPPAPAATASAAASASQPHLPKGRDRNPIDILTPPPEDLYLSRSSHLTRQELLRRRLHRARQLTRVYRDYYWALMEELRVQYREYYWRFGISPYKVEDEGGEVGDEMNHNVDAEGSGETNHVCLFNNGPGAGGGKLGLGYGENGGLGASNRCGFVGCKLKAMALTNFCHLHILSDPQQKLYKACNYVIKSAQAGPITCGKPILRSVVPSLCNIHFQKAQKHVTRALRKAGLNVTSSNKLAPKFHVIVAEFIGQIQARRRAMEGPNVKSMVVKEEHAS